MVGRNTTSAFISAISAGTIQPHILLDAEFSDGTVYLWNGDYSLSWNGQTYLGAGNLLTIGQINESTDLKVNDISVSFSGIDTAYKTLALSQVDIDNDVTIRFALITAGGSIVADPEIIFEGKMDEVGINESAPISTFTLGVQNKLARLQTTNERRYTLQDHKDIYSTDTGLRHMVNSERETKWGSG
jgi:hypothetical protein